MTAYRHKLLTLTILAIATLSSPVLANDIAQAAPQATERTDDISISASTTQGSVLDDSAVTPSTDKPSAPAARPTTPAPGQPANKRQ